MMGYIEYLATLVSPHPKETIKAIESRHKPANSSESKVYVNTTFLDAIAAESGQDAVEDLKRHFDDLGDSPPPELDSIEF